MRVILLALLFLAGCGGSDYEPATDNHGHGYQFDAQGASGLKLRYTPVFDASHPFSDVAFYERVFEDMQRCAGLSAPAPFVIVIAQRTPAGIYYSDPPLVTIDENVLSLRHEIIHYLLDYATGDIDAAHGSPLFAKCS